MAGAQPSAATHRDVAGFSIDRPRPKSNLTAIKGKATVRHLRTGDTEELAYEARAQGPLNLVAKVGKQSFALPALPEEAREPIALALLCRLAAAPVVSAREAEQALELARSAGSAGDRIDPVLVPVFGGHPAAPAGVAGGRVGHAPRCWPWSPRCWTPSPRATGAAPPAPSRSGCGRG